MKRLPTAWRVVALAVMASCNGIVGAADITWTGNGADRNWSTAANWSSDPDAPLNPTVDRLVFDNGDISDTVAKRLADIPDWNGETATNLWRIGGLRIVNTTGRHLLDLDGKTLWISTTNGSALGDLYVRGATAHLVASNGMLVVERDILVDRGHLDLGGTTLHGSPRDLAISKYVEGTASVDMRGAVITGGELDLRNLYVAAIKTAPGYWSMDGTTGIDHLRVRETVEISDSQGSIGRIGWQDPARANEYYLPPDLNITIGVRADGEAGRGNVSIGLVRTGGSGSSDGRLAVDAGGAFDAWLSFLDVGRNVMNNTIGRGRLDLRGLDAFRLDAEDLRVGTTLADRTGTADGIVYLPAGTARVARVYLGHEGLNNRAILDLTGTLLEVSETVDLRDTTAGNPTELAVHVRGMSCGPDLAADATLAVTGPVSIKLLFEAEPMPGQDPYWGLRLAGNHAAVIGALKDSGTLTIEMDFDESEDYRTAVFYEAGYTHAGLVGAHETLPPAVKGRDRVVEVRDAVTTRMDANDVILALYNPDHLAETGREIAHPDVNGGASAAYLDFPTAVLPGTYAGVTLTIRYADGVTAVDTATVAFVTVADASTTDLTWTGLASDYVHLDRPEWFWGANWAGDQPPANPTAGVIAFADDDADGDVPKRLMPIPDWNGLAPTNAWRIGGLRGGNTVGRHTLDLGERTLQVGGGMLVERLFPLGAADMVVTNGTLDVGGNVAASSIATLTLADARLVLSPDSTLRSDPGCTIVVTADTTIAGPFKRLLVGAAVNYSSGTGILDMHAGRFTGGLLDVEDLRVSGHSGGGSYGQFRLGPTTLDSLRVRRHFWLNSTGGAGNNQRGWARIGAPDPARGNRWYLPVNVNLYIGAPEARGTLQLNWNTSSYLSQDVSLLGISSGGHFEAWLSTLIVGEDNGTTGKAVVDLRGLDSFFMDVEQARIGAVTRDPPNAAQGEVYWPSGRAIVGRLEMGRTGSAASFGRLELNDTQVTITNRLTLHASARVTVNVGARPGGIELINPEPGAMTIHSNATIAVNFLAPPIDRPHFGLRLAGNHLAVLQSMEAAGNLTIDDAGIGMRPARIFYSLDGFTYVGLPLMAGVIMQIR